MIGRRIPHVEGQDPHQELETDFDLWTGQHQLTWSVISVCDRYRPLPPPDAPDH